MKLKDIDVVKIVCGIILGMFATLLIMGLLFAIIKMWKELIGLF